MKHNTGTQKRSSLFLIELMISIFFFAIASSVCIQLFAKAKLITDETSARNQALLQAQSAASVFYAGGGTLRLIPEAFPEATAISASASVTAEDAKNAKDPSALSGETLESYEILFDKSWTPCAPTEDAAWRMTVSVFAAPEEKLSTADISVFGMEKGDTVYQLQVQYHGPQSAGPSPSE